ncbi:MAG: O-antigen ligase family protein [Verrucomicrobiales bacterium]|nr:O-antigen ligase family protein [Verrucomicrobiales bacterium]
MMTSRPVTFFGFATLVYAFSSSFLYRIVPWLPGSIWASTVVYSVGLVLFTFGKSRGTTFGLLGALVPITVVLGALNVLLSTRPVLSLAKILGWIAVVVLARDLARHSSPLDYRRVQRFMPFMLASVGGFMLLQGAEDADLLFAMRHMASTYLGLAMVAGLFSPRLIWKCVWIVVGVVGVYFSASRGAFLALPAAVAGYAVYLMLKKQVKDAVALLVLTGLVGTVFLTPSLRDAFFAKKTRRYDTGYASLVGGAEQRLFLTEEAWKQALANPLGTGAGRTYTIVYGGMRLGAHNGYLDTLAQLGFPSTILLFAWYATLVLKVLRNRGFPVRDKALFMTYLVVLHVRALGESYSVFDAASFFVLLLWYMTFYGAYDARGAVTRQVVSSARSRLGSAQRFRVRPAMPLVRGGGHLQRTRAGMEHTGQPSQGSASRSAGDRA